MTLTVRHDRKTALKAEREVMTEAFRRLQHGGLWTRLKRAGLAGLVRVPEVTWGLGLAGTFIFIRSSS